MEKSGLGVFYRSSISHFFHSSIQLRRPEKFKSRYPNSPGLSAIFLKMNPIRKIPAPARGFSMLEMMAVVAVIAILGALALPSYLGRIVRQQIEASYPLADVAKKNIGAAWVATHTLPADNAAAGLP